MRPAPAGQYFRHFLSSIMKLVPQNVSDHIPNLAEGFFGHIRKDQRFVIDLVGIFFWTRQQRWEAAKNCPS